MTSYCYYILRFGPCILKTYISFPYHIIPKEGLPVNRIGIRRERCHIIYKVLILARPPAIGCEIHMIIAKICKARRFPHPKQTNNKMLRTPAPGG
jgi:hypothetical protein